MPKKEKIFHLSIRNFSRSKGHNGIQKGAYRTGLKIEDEKRGLIFNYEKKSQKENISYEMILPSGSSDKFNDPKYFYNEIERSEKRSDARLFKEIELSLYQELTPEENKNLAKEFAEEISQKYNVPVNVNFHKLDSDNPHTHIVVGLRSIEGEHFSSKKNRDLDKKEFIHQTRQRWEELSNQTFHQKELDLFVSHKSYKSRGIDKVPGRHINRKHLEPEEKQEDLSFNKSVKKYNRRQDFKRQKNNVTRTTEQEKDLVSSVRSSRTIGKEVNEMDKKMTVSKLYNNEIETLKNQYGERKKSISEKLKSEKEKRQKLQQGRVSFKEKKDKHQNVMFHKKNDLQELKFGQKELKGELNSHSKFNPFNWKKRREIKRQMVHNKIQQKRKKLEMKREKERLKYHKKQLNEKKKDLRNERKEIFKLYKNQAITKVKTMKLSKEKKKVKDLTKTVENVVSLKDFKQKNKVEIKKMVKEKTKSLA
ncbi:MobA/MobL family protein [Priestia flexa]|uniref:MobA/MobL family protein n=1 Tax=Priestia flexa TaxID=86664 RepID=UPI00092CB720|nr:DNA strand transferase [Mycobacteroides abscessus subsp. abscessus]